MRKKNAEKRDNQIHKSNMARSRRPAGQMCIDKGWVAGDWLTCERFRPRKIRSVCTIGGVEFFGGSAFVKGLPLDTVRCDAPNGR